MHKIKIADKADTVEDIIEPLINILPVAVEQMAQYNHLFNYTPQTAEQAARFICKYCQDNFTYVQDNIYEQNIKLPSAMFRDKNADCKSFSLFCIAYLAYYQIDCGFTFVGYPPNKNEITHVYCFYLDNQNKFVFFDPCITGFRESANFGKKFTMSVNYIAGVPAVSFKKNKAKLNGLNTYFAAPVRTAGLILIRLNFRGWATALDVAINNNAQPAQQFWTDFGGTWDKFLEAVNAGKNKNPLMSGGAAYDAAVGDTWWAQMDQQNQLNDLLANAIQQGFVPPIQPIDWSNPSVKLAYIQWLGAFFEQIGNAVLTNTVIDPAATNAAQPSGNTAWQNNSNSGFIPNSNTPKIKMTGAEIGALIGAAIPILIAMPKLLEAMGVENVPNGITEAADAATAMNPVDENTDVSILDQFTNLFGGTDAQGNALPFFRLDNPIVLLGGGLLAYKLLKPKRK